MSFISNSFFVGTFFLGAASTLCAEKSAPQAQPPNIILFLVDDMGWQDTSVPFWHVRTPLNDRYVTPGMERLAKRGVKFTNAYACAVCSPSRVSLMTGMNAARHRVTTWTLNYNRDPVAPPAQSGIKLPKWNVNGISPYPMPDGLQTAPSSVSAYCLPQMLRDVGYKTIHVGKAHFGSKGAPEGVLTAENPLSIGFDVNIAGSAIGGPGSYFPPYGRGGTFAIRGLEEFDGTKTFLTEALTIKALQQIDSAVSQTKPFFLYMSHYAVHCPFQADPEFIQTYRGIGLPGVEPEYASMVQGMDASLCKILDRLEARGVADNTVVIFMADNGGYALGDRSQPAQVQNAPASAGKGAVYEGGLRVPMIVSWPGMTDSVRICETPVIIEDFLPSLIEIAGGKIDQSKLAPGQVIDGKSFIPMIKGKEEVTRPLFFHYPNSWGAAQRVPGYGAYSAVLSNGWKYIYYHEEDSSLIGSKTREELFYIPEDIGEKKNVIAHKHAKRDELRNLLSDWLRKTRAQMPTRKKDGKPIPYPNQLKG